MIRVVGAAIVRHGCVLAARRSCPATEAGRWEFPGGKVDPGETPEDALAREIGEELVCVVRVESWLTGAVRGSDRGRELELRVALCTLTEGEPSGTEHDALRWLAPEELDDVDWLEPDRPFLTELRDVLLDGERLPGGNVGGAVRIGATVRRPTGPWTPAVHALLGHLAATGLPAVPRAHGIDARGREVLDYLPGEVIDVNAEVLTDARLAALGRWLRALHTGASGFNHPGPWRFFGVDAPTLTEAGVDVVLTNWRGVIAPPGISAADRAALTELFAGLEQTPEWQQKLAENHWTGAFLAGDEFDAFLHAEDQRVRDTLAERGLG